MKTLIITGTARQVRTETETTISYQVEYNVTIYGQSPASPEVQLITWFKQTLTGYNELQEVCRAKYAKYFQTDLFNIISMENINLI